SILDIETIFKSSQTLLSEKSLDQLLKKIMKHITQNAGADKGILIIPKKGEWFIEAEYHVNSGYIRVLKSEPVISRLPVSIFNYTVNTRESIVVNNVNKETELINDPYINKYRPLSILCIPLVNHGNIQAV